jgi:Xaa-Pro dipeptidase
MGTNLQLYRSHLETLDRILDDALTRAGRRGVRLDGLLFHAGRAASYHADDQDIIFRPTPHFARYTPIEGPEHCVLARPGKRPRLVRVAPRDYWYEVAPLPPSYWQEALEVVEVSAFAEVTKVLGALPRIAYVGSSSAAAAELGIASELVEPEAVMRPLDWHRAIKTGHEVALIDEAARRAAAGQHAARDAFSAGGSERDIHWAYLRGSQQLERDNPFETIVAIDDKTATLHYQNKRARIESPRQSFMLDAGATCDGYASDITRTWASASAEPAYRALLEGLDAAQRELVAMVTPGRPYLEIHVASHRLVARLLVETKVARCSADEAMASGLTRTFLPHGVGHHLGLQVHDVGGRQADVDGGVNAPPAEYPSLRNTRRLEPGHLVTIEPGIYFIPMLLERLRAEPAGKQVDWALIERLVACGGMRIEDDILCCADGPKDLTRPHIVGPRGV